MDNNTAASATTATTTLSEDIFTEMCAYQIDHALQMKRLTNLVAYLSTSSPTPPALREHCKKKSHSAPEKLQEDMGDSRRCRLHGVRVKHRQTLAKLEEQPQIGYIGEHTKER